MDGFLLALFLGGYSFVPIGPIVLLVPTRSLLPITLKPDAHHLITDVWTAAGALTVAVALSGWERLDPIIALLVAANIFLLRSRKVILLAKYLEHVYYTPPQTLRCC